MFPHRHSQLCLPDAPTSLDSSVGLDVKGEAEPGSSVRRPSCAYFQTPWSRSCLSHKPQLSILYPFIQVLFLAQLSNKGIFSASTSRHPIPALDCTVNEGLFSFTSVSFYIPQWLMFMKISHSKFNSQTFFVVVVVDRENPFSGDTHHKRRVDFSMFSKSQFDLLLRYWMHSGEGDQSVALFLSNKAGWAANPQSRKSKCDWAESWGDDGTLSAARRGAGVTERRLQGSCNLLSGALRQKLYRLTTVMCSPLCDDESYEAHLPHKSFICHTDFNGETFALSTERRVCVNSTYTTSDLYSCNL